MGPKHINASVLSFSTIIFSFKLPESRLIEGHSKPTALYLGVVLLPAAKGKLRCTGSTGLLRKMQNCEENPTRNKTSHRHHHFPLQGQNVLFHICTLPAQVSVGFTFIFTPMRTLCHETQCSLSRKNKTKNKPSVIFAYTNNVPLEDTHLFY